jgi:hypothetical protein
MTEVLCQVGYKRFGAVPSSDYPAIEDYLHGSIHGAGISICTTGLPGNLLNYRLPWESIVLSSRVFWRTRDLHVM